MERIWRSMRSSLSRMSKSESQSASQSVRPAKKKQKNSHDPPEPVAEVEPETETVPQTNVGPESNLPLTPAFAVPVDPEYCSPADSQPVVMETAGESYPDAEAGNTIGMDAVYDQLWKSVDQLLGTSLEESGVQQGDSSSADELASLSQSQSADRGRPKMGLNAVMMSARTRLPSNEFCASEGTETKSKPESPEQKAVYDEPWDDQAKRLQMIFGPLQLTGPTTPPTPSPTLQLPPCSEITTESGMNSDAVDVDDSAPANDLETIGDSAIDANDADGKEAIDEDATVPAPASADQKQPENTPIVADVQIQVEIENIEDHTEQANDSLESSVFDTMQHELDAPVGGGFSFGLPSALLCPCGCGRPAGNAALASFVSPLRPRAAFRNPHLAPAHAHAHAHALVGGHCSIGAGAGVNFCARGEPQQQQQQRQSRNQTLGNSVFSLTPTLGHRRTTEDSSSCKCTFVKHNGNLLPKPCAECLRRAGQSRSSDKFFSSFGIGIGAGEREFKQQTASAKHSVSSLSQEPPASPRISKPRLDNYSWYFGALSRHNAENLLQNQPEGTFLVRKCETSAADYAISIRSADSFVHMKIARHVCTRFSTATTISPRSVVKEHYVLGSFSQPYDTVVDIVRHFRNSTLPVKGIRGLMLKHALRRDHDYERDSGSGSGSDQSHSKQLAHFHSHSHSQANNNSNSNSIFRTTAKTNAIESTSRKSSRSNASSTMRDNELTGSRHMRKPRTQDSTMLTIATRV